LVFFDHFITELFSGDVPNLIRIRNKAPKHFSLNPFSFKKIESLNDSTMIHYRLQFESLHVLLNFLRALDY
jgi:hypothetical protein